MSDYIRARSPEQKAERMESILDAAEALFVELPYHEINMGLIAKELGWSRSNLYKYAATQEDIFLSLHSRANRAFIEALIEKLGDGSCTNERFAAIWAQTAAQHPEFLRYQDILISIIESNASLERLVEFKRAFANMTSPLLLMFQKRFGCNISEAQDIYLRLIYQAPGLFNQFHCAEKTAEAMKIAGMPPITGKFESAYADFIVMCLEAADAKSGSTDH